MSEAVWRVLGRSVRGASHLRSGLPNQDAVGWLPEGPGGSAVVLAVSDGHGSAKAVRSDRGARFAVAAALAELGHLLDAPVELAAVLRQRERLASSVVRRWEEAWVGDLEKEPFVDAEFAALEKKEGPAGRKKVEDRPGLAYGATLLAVLVGPAYTIYLQLGDGDILAVNEGGEVRRPIARDERLMGNETTSLCSRNAAQEVRIAVESVEVRPAPALVLASTDGYANSFSSEPDFLKVGGDLLDLLADEGIEVVDGELAGWLEHASRVGSGDDVTLGLLCRPAALDLHRARPRPSAPAVAPVAQDAAPPPAAPEGDPPTT